MVRKNDPLLYMSEKKSLVIPFNLAMLSSIALFFFGGGAWIFGSRDTLLSLVFFLGGALDLGFERPFENPLPL